jgi:NAD(P)-dependent dehydrogenase (short-subunit alcohol dehydrogenase family)
MVPTSGGEAQPAIFDVTDDVSVSVGVAALGHVDILVNNAGAADVGGRTAFAESTPDEWEPLVRVNMYGVLNCTRVVLPGMIESAWGRVITIVSDAGRVGDAGGAVCGAAKAAAAGFTRSIALENGRHGVTANNISLGTMRTSSTEPLWADRAHGGHADAILR